MRRRLVWATSVLVAASFMVAACGDDSGSNASSTTVGSSATTASGAVSSTPASTGGKPTGDPYKIGVPARLSGTGSVAYIAVQPTAKAWESWINDNGGINGHPVQVIMGDAAGDAAKGLSVVRKMVESDKVSFIHPEDPTIDATVQPYLTQQNVAAASSFLPHPLWNTTPNFFALGFNAVTQGYEYYVALVKEQGFKSIGAMVCAEVAACASADAQLQKFAPPAGLRYDGTLKVAATAPNYTAECLSFKNKGTEVLVTAFSIDTTKRVVNDCATQGFHPTFVFPGTVLNERAKELPDITAYDALPSMPWYFDAAPAKEYRDVLAKYQPGTVPDQSGAQVWTALQWFAEAARKANLPENPTHEQVNAALAALKTNVGGLTPDLSFTLNQPSPQVKCYFAAEYSKGQFLAPKGDKPVCP